MLTGQQANGPEVRMLVAAHKAAPMPEDKLYVPIQVGRSLSTTDLGYLRDNEGDNISHKNGSYCELTALYWAWKNLEVESVGLSHYRRYFVGDAAGPNGTRVLSLEDASDLMRSYDMVIARPRKYYIETIESHYRNGHFGSDLDALRDIVAKRQPGYVGAFDRVFKGRKLSLYNMCLMRRDVLGEYASWVFGLLGELESAIDNADRTPYQRRTFGFLGERLLNVWAEAHSDALHIVTRRTVNIEGESRFSKAVAMTQRKLDPDRYRA